jgi:hypothetical protein
MSRRDALLLLAVVALCLGGLTYLTIAPPDPLDRAGADATWARERGE